jgi:hypothetical protein
MAAVQEPPQAKIKLKVPSGQDTPVPNGAKKVASINVGGNSATSSPAPPAGQLNDADVAGNGTPGRALRASSGQTAALPFGQLDKAASVSASVASPSPSVLQANALAHQSPAVDAIIPNGVATTGQNGHQVQPGMALQNGIHQPALQRSPLIWDGEFRAPGRGMLSLGFLLAETRG